VRQSIQFIHIHFLVDILYWLRLILRLILTENICRSLRLASGRRLAMTDNKPEIVEIQGKT
jgi:hypothetical protein